MAKQARVRVVGAVPSRAASPHSEAMKQSIARAQEHVNAIKGRKTSGRSNAARAS